MENVFLTVLNMNLTASYIIPFVVLARLLLQKVPKVYSYCLWSVVLFRLLCPFSLESAISLLPKEEKPITTNSFITERLEIQAEIPTNVQGVSPDLSENLPIVHSAEVENNHNFTYVAQILWIFGIIVMLLVASVSLLRLKKKLMVTKELEKGVFLADDITSPFVFGVISPKIYLPSSINEEEIPLILAHERFHLKRFDHVTRLLSFVALTLHWFNPLVWLSYYLSEKDMETSCDEGVLREKSLEERGDYATALLKFTGRRSSLTPLAFSENDTKGRVRNIMKMKKTKLWVSGLAGILVVMLILGLSTNQSTTEEKNLKHLSEGQTEVTETKEGTEILSTNFEEILRENEILVVQTNGLSFRLPKQIDIMTVNRFVFPETHEDGWYQYLNVGVQQGSFSDRTLEESADSWQKSGDDFLRETKLEIETVGADEEVLKNVKVLYPTETGYQEKAAYLPLLADNGEEYHYILQALNKNPHIETRETWTIECGVKIDDDLVFFNTHVGKEEEIPARIEQLISILKTLRIDENGLIGDAPYSADYYQTNAQGEVIPYYPEYYQVGAD